MAEYLSSALLIAAGLMVLLAGGELLVRGASRLAALCRISPLTIGLTVVAFGTSAPELAVVLQSAFANKTDLAIGNVVGSCVFNVLFVLGLTAIVLPVVVSARLVRLEVPLMIGASALLWIFGLDGVLRRWEGFVLFTGLVAYVTWTVMQSRRESLAFQGNFEGAIQTRAGAHGNGALGKAAVQVGPVVAGLACLALGSSWLVDGSVGIAQGLGLSQLMIGLTIIAVGTSLPEIVTSILAAARGHSEIAVGNVVGSNILNVLCVLGLPAAVAPRGIAVSPDALYLDIPVMIAVCVACLPIFFTQYRIDRWEGYLFLGYYVAYTIYLILHATQPERGHSFGLIMLGVVVPLTVITLATGVLRAWPAQIRSVRILARFGSRRASPSRSVKRSRSAARVREKRLRRRKRKRRKRPGIR